MIPMITRPIMPSRWRKNRRRARLPGDSSRAPTVWAMRGGAAAMSPCAISAVPDAWVGVAVGDVGEQIHDEDDGRQDDRDAHDQEEVSLVDPLDHHLTKSGPGEHRLGHDGRADDLRYRQADDR